SAGAMMEALLPLGALTAAGVAVLVLHHPSKRPAPEGRAARGRGAPSGHAGGLVGFRAHPPRGGPHRRRPPLAFSRFRETPRQVVVELNEEGTDYLWLGDVAEEAFRGGWEVLRTVLLGAAAPLTRRQVLAEWPAVEVKPDEGTLWRWLERGVR